MSEGNSKILSKMQDAGVTWAFMRESRTRDLVVGCTGENRSGFLTICAIPDDVVIERAIYIMQRDSSECDGSLEHARKLENLGRGLKEAAIEDKARTEKAIYAMRLFLTDGGDLPDPKVLP